MKFDWDQGNTKKCSDSVRGAEIEKIIAAEDTVISGDPYLDEKRFRAIGKNHEGRHVFVAFTIREINGEAHVRPIGARYEHRKKRKGPRRSSPIPTSTASTMPSRRSWIRMT